MNYTIFDAHCHIYPENLAPRAVAAIDQFYDGLPEEHRDGTTATLLKTGREAGISRFLVHSVATKPHQVSSINRFIAREVAASEGAFIGLGTLHLCSGDMESDLRELMSLGLKGVKLHPDIQRFRADEPRAMRVYEMCEDAGLPVLLHAGDSRFDYSNPPRIANVLRAFPRLRLIGAHFGGWSVWDEAARTLADFDNIVVDSSSTFYAVGMEKGRELITIWGSDRVLFGTDYPMWSPRPDIEALMRMELTDRDYKKIFWDNAAKVYGA